ncbi:glycosyltransferase [Aquimarina sp. U1-2]|uniref:glycosyltransferase n=1 Tax=Aquimarina sp. U1-2 TaxID=2823141 RepID=UPI001AEC9477|nr:glycosyltransferase [Aquimarina sp. U1-2]MBP2832923.1 glycosyltransferase [Aquimarina sp. U1-2]
MNIGIIAHDAHPIAEPFQGGLEMITHLLVKELTARNHHVTVLCLKESNIDAKSINYQCVGVETDDNTPGDQIFDNIRNVTRSLTEFLSKDFDIIHNHSLHYLSIILGNQSRVPFITTFHTPIFKNLSLGLQSILPSVNQCFTAVSKSLANTYKELLPEVDTIYNGIDVDKWQYQLKSHEDYYVWSGRICPEKGVTEAITHCIEANLKLKIAGPVGDTTYFTKKVLPLIETNENFEYLGHLCQTELNVVVKNAKAAIFSSTWNEPYGLVIAEALACGVPVIANAVGAASEILDTTCGSLFQLNDQKSFESAVDSCANLKRKHCRIRAVDFCSHYTMVDHYEKLYMYVLNKTLVA